MTLHPKPFAMACGTASHVHISVDGDKGNDPAIYEPFYAGILKHLRAICAFTYSSEASYERVADGTWAGGTYVAWGTQNRPGDAATQDRGEPLGDQVHGRHRQRVPGAGGGGDGGRAGRAGRGGRTAAGGAGGDDGGRAAGAGDQDEDPANAGWRAGGVVYQHLQNPLPIYLIYDSQRPQPIQLRLLPNLNSSKDK